MGKPATKRYSRRLMIAMDRLDRSIDFDRANGRDRAVRALNSACIFTRIVHNDDDARRQRLAIGEVRRLLTAAQRGRRYATEVLP